MRILTAVHNLTLGGTQRAAQNYSIGYKQAGHDVAVLAYDSGGPRQKALERAGIPVFTPQNTGEGYAQATAVKNALDWKPDIVHLHRRGNHEQQTGDLLRTLLSTNPRPKVIETNVFARVDFSDDRKLIDVHLQLSRWCLWKWRKWARSCRPEPLGAIVPYGVETQSFFRTPPGIRRAFRKEHSIPERAFVFGRLGQPIVWKWSSVIFDAFAAVAEAHPNAYLLLAGLPETLRANLDNLSPAVRNRVVEVPFLRGDESLRAAYNSMDVFLHASQIGESFGMVLAEAMLCGCPVITLSTPAKDNSQVEVVGHERGGLVIVNTSSMIMAMQRLMRDKTLCARLADQGETHTRDVYGLDTVMSDLLRITDHVYRASSRETLRQALTADQAITTSISDHEIYTLLNDGGRISPQDRFFMHLVHQPRLYRLWERIKKV